jgi:hypothetical protein
MQKQTITVILRKTGPCFTSKQISDSYFLSPVNNTEGIKMLPLAYLNIRIVYLRLVKEIYVLIII